MRLRRAEEADLSAISELEKECFSVPWSFESFREILDRTPYVMLVAEEEAKILGYAVLLSVFDEGDLMNIAVAERARRQGIGEALLSRILEAARERGVKKLFLEVREHNTPAIRMYEKNGFVFFGKRKEYYEKPTEDALLYQKDLEEAAG